MKCYIDKNIKHLLSNLSNGYGRDSLCQIGLPFNKTSFLSLWTIKSENVHEAFNLAINLASVKIL